ncbi:EI24 domain-containing protein [Rhodoferax sp.]|uniref:EI24 domain-containing protein n=1 Tax=Rhodoferax sp. TaxID=50421 RepID=UPI00261FF694|nr:EI24 domain-containing protein [Rhodoferax sp.]MDD2925861.1 EI24 domain-containing protein [Rhodoferax sp.]
MNLLFDSFWRAVAYCFRPRVMLLSVMPLLLMLLLALGFRYLYWQSLLDWVTQLLTTSTIMGTVQGWLQGFGLASPTAFLAPLLVLLAVMPVIVVVSLLLVALLMTPALTALVADKRFATLERKNGGSLLQSLMWSLMSTVLALVALLVSVPLWLIPPLILVLPPLIWGWLTYRVMAFDALAVHASRQERREIFRRHRLALLGMGVVCGYLGAAPSVIWASGVLFATAFMVLIPIGVWLYALVFALSSLWFAHYCLAALHALRIEPTPATVEPVTPPDIAVTDPQALPLHHEPKPSDPPNQ